MNTPALSIENIEFNNEKVWDLICSGNSRGLFQCESQLVSNWLKKIKPRNLTELSAVIAAVRPGCLESGGTDEYLAYKNGDLEYESIHPVVDDILNATHHSLLYQEQLILLGRRLAWQHLNENDQLLKADELRKAVGKKNQEKILKIGKEFVEGCLINKVDQQIADNLFQIIKNSGRYLFNLSHSFKYAVVCYITAWLKYHYPLQFFATYLSYSRYKATIKKYGKEISSKWIEISDLHREMKKFDIELLPPNINKKNSHFTIEDGKIRYALSEVKHVSATANKILTLPDKIDTWQKFVLLGYDKFYGFEMKSNAMEALVKSGAFIDVKWSRADMINLCSLLNDLSGAELAAFIEWVKIQFNRNTTQQEIVDFFNSEAFLENVQKKRMEKVKSYLTFLKLGQEDDPENIGEYELQYLGVNLTLSKLDNIMMYGHESPISECVPEMCRLWEKKTINVIIEDLKITTTKTGKNPGQKMAMLKVRDGTGTLDKMPVFPEAYANFSELLLQGNTVQLLISNGKKGWIVDKVQAI